MKIDFEDRSFIEIKIGSPGNVAVILGAKNRNDGLKFEINACEITINQFAQLVNDLGIELPKIIKQKQ